MAGLEANKDLIRRAYEVCVNGRQFERAAEFYADDYEGRLGGLHEAHGPVGYVAAVKANLEAFPDLHEVPEVLIAEGDRVMVRHRLSGTHLGPFLGVPPTGKAFSITGIDIYRIAAGKIVEEDSLPDLFAFLQQVGALATPVPAG